MIWSTGWLAILLPLVLAAAAGCGGGTDASKPSPGPRASPAPNAPPSEPAAPSPGTPSASAIDSSISPAAARAPILPYPPGQMTGRTALDSLIATLTSGDPGAIAAVLQETPSPCVVNPQGIHNPPACPAGVPAGTMLPVFRASGGEAIWPEQLASVLTTVAPRNRSLFAVYEPAPYRDPWIPASEVVVIAGDVGRTSVAAYFVVGERVAGAIFVPWIALEGVFARFPAQSDVLPLRPGAAGTPSAAGGSVVDAIVAAVQGTERERFVKLLRPTPIACEDGYVIAPECGGAPQGTPVAAVWSFQCEARWVSIEAIAASRLSLPFDGYRLSAVTEGGPPVGRAASSAAVERWVLFDGTIATMPGALAVAVAGNSVVGFGFSCGEPTTFKEQFTAAAAPPATATRAR